MAETLIAYLSLSYGHDRLEYHATVRELPSSDRPRERMQHFGPQVLSTAELLTIILHTGTRGGNVLEMANKLLTKYGGLSGLVRADFRYALLTIASFVFVWIIRRLRVGHVCQVASAKHLCFLSKDYRPELNVVH